MDRTREDASAQQALATAVAEFSAATRFPVAFGGYEYGGTTTITACAGNRTSNLTGLQVKLHRGLGGRAMVERRPRLANNYARSRQITHDYDPEILSEGIVTLLAMPVVLDGVTRAILYGGTRGSVGPSATFLHDASSVADALAHEIQVQDEVQRRLHQHESLLAAQQARDEQHAVTSMLREGLRSGHAELRSIIADVADPDLRSRLHALAARFAGLSDSPAAPPPDAPRLSPRELDVVSFAALGCSNAEIALRLSLAESTVKSYFATAMSKLGASNRHAAVTAARRYGLIL